MTEILNLIEIYLEYKGFSWARLDGSTKLADRQEQINEFNSIKDSRQASDDGINIFLLSTRAGGLGINLTAADTAIIFDSDWNPHMDSQAQSRCHRIGQTRHVVVYRYLTTASVEIDMMKKQLSKKKLERLAIEGGEFQKAGRRASGSHRVSLDDLRRLLEDDVKNLERQQERSSSSEVEGHVLMTTTEGIQVDVTKDISDQELEMIMNRERLFKAEILAIEEQQQGKLKDGQQDENNRALYRNATLMAPGEEDVEEIILGDHGEETIIKKKTTPSKASASSSSASKAATTIPAMNSGKKAAGISPATSGKKGKGKASAGKGGKAAKEEAVVSIAELEEVPLEGEMYDVVQDSTASGGIMNIV